MRRSMLVSLIVSLMFTMSGLVRAGVGVPDANNDYPYVGVMVIFDLDAPADPIGANVSAFCSGVLISEIHFLTAAHCIDWISTVNDPFIGVSFADLAAPIISTMIPVTGYSMHPGYPPGQFVFRNDLGIVALAPGYTLGITPASLPLEGYLDDLAAEGELVGQPVVNVGYGVVPFLTRPPGYFPPDGVRSIFTSTFLGLDQNFVRQRQNLNADDEGGSASGDSGSPKFLPGETTILAITSWGDPTGREFGANVRVDTPEALSFINGFLQP